MATTATFSHNGRSEDSKTTTMRAVLVLGLIIAVLAAIAAAVGVFWQGSVQHYDFTTLRGDTVAMQGGDGLYRLDSVSGASQEIAGDIVTLCLGIPMLIVALV